MIANPFRKMRLERLTVSGILKPHAPPPIEEDPRAAILATENFIHRAGSRGNVIRDHARAEAARLAHLAHLPEEPGNGEMWAAIQRIEAALLRIEKRLEDKR